MPLKNGHHLFGVSAIEGRRHMPPFILSKGETIGHTGVSKKSSTNISWEMRIQRDQTAHATAHVTAHAIVHATAHAIGHVTAHATGLYEEFLTLDLRDWSVTNTLKLFSLFSLHLCEELLFGL